MCQTKVIHLPPSKSIAARELMVDHLLFSSARERYQYYKALYDRDLPVDVIVLGEALKRLEEQGGGEVALDCHESGTALRFLTALAALRSSPTTLHCSSRLAERPLTPLLSVYEGLGAHFTWHGTTLHVSPAKSRRFNSTIDTTHWSSSQFASSILLTAPLLDWNTLRLKVAPEAPSFSYLWLTIQLLRARGIECTYTGEVIEIKRISPISATLKPVEADWSSTSYIYQLLAIGGETEPIYLPGLQSNSHQPDAKITDIFALWGVSLDDNQVLHRTGSLRPRKLDLDLSQQIDLFPALAVTCTATGVPFHFRGIKTLRHKESDRLCAVREGLENLGYSGFTTGANTLSWDGTEPATPTRGAHITTYNDHRITMAFAILDAARDLGLHLSDKESVTKSFPSFWEQLSQLQ
ncbi:MAG: hypothetical protein Q4D93_01100 [Porphyromonas sp.]|nr:hypothetical protein [Porphyromonas sp.]